VGGNTTDSRDQELLRALHEEKVTAQHERASYVTRKMAFVTVLFGLSSLSLGIEIARIYWLLYFIPLVAICYDSYIMAADARVKRIGAFLARQPVAGEVEREWERFSAVYRSSFSPFTDTALSIVVTVAAAIYLFSQQQPPRGGALRLLFALWLVGSLLATLLLWSRHRELLKRIDRYEEERPAA
jgi:hypothetical protein